MNTLYSLSDDSGLKRVTVEFDFDEVKRSLQDALKQRGIELEVTDWDSVGLAIMVYAERASQGEGESL